MAATTHLELMTMVEILDLREPVVGQVDLFHRRRNRVSVSNGSVRFMRTVDEIVGFVHDGHFCPIAVRSGHVRFASNSSRCHVLLLHK